MMILKFMKNMVFILMLSILAAKSDRDIIKVLFIIIINYLSSCTSIDQSEPEPIVAK